MSEEKKEIINRKPWLPGKAKPVELCYRSVLTDILNNEVALWLSRGGTLKSFSEAIGISHTHLNVLRKGHMVPAGYTLAMGAKALETPIEFFVNK